MNPPTPNRSDIEGAEPLEVRAVALEEKVSAGSFDEIYRSHVSFVWRICQRMRVPEMNIDDAVQDVFIVVHRRLVDFDGSVPLRAWLYGIVSRVVADHRKRFRRKESAVSPMDSERNLGVETFASSLPAPERSLEASQALGLVEQLLERLPEEKREALVLSRLYEMTVPEIAAATGGNVNTIYSRLRVAEREFEALYATHLATGVSP